MNEGFKPILPHTARGTLVAPRQFEILRIIAKENAKGRYPNRYEVAKQQDRARTHGFAAIRKLIAIELVTDYQSGQRATTRQNTSKLALTHKGRLEVQYWSQYYMRGSL